MRFKTNIKSNKCFDINYDPIYLNRYTDSLSIANSLKINTDDKELEFHFNFLKIYSNDLTTSAIEYIFSNVLLNDKLLANLIKILLFKKSNLLFNENLLFFRNIQPLNYNIINLKKFEDYISKNFEYPHIILYCKTDLRHFGYKELYTNYYTKQLY